MPTAQIMVNGFVGSNDDVPINVLVQLNNNNQGGELTFSWTIIDQPPGPADALSSTIAVNPTFTPKKEGTYLIRVVVNSGLSTQQIDEQIVGVRQLKTRERVPAFTETNQDGGGWQGAADSWLRRLDRLAADPGLVVGVNASGGPLSRGTLVQLNHDTVIKAGLPGQEVLADFIVADPSGGLTAAYRAFDEPLLIVEGAVDGTVGPVANGDLVRARLFGLFTGLTVAGAPGLGVPLYPGAGGSAGELVPVTDVNLGLLQRQLGYVVHSPGGNLVDIWFQGVGRMPPPQMLVFGSGTTSNVGGTTQFLNPMFSPNAAETTEPQIPIFAPGIITAMLVRARVAPVGADLTLTARKNGIDTTDVATLLAGFNGAVSSSLFTFPVVFNDLISIKCVTGGGIVSGAADLYAVLMYLPRSLF
jgi:hypothetical protein